MSEPDKSSRKQVTKRPKSKARQKFGEIRPPARTPDETTPNRNEWIETVCSEFVAPSTSNRKYYKIILECLWPNGHGIPGPLVKESSIRDAIDRVRKAEHKGTLPYRPYVDVFRRLRELQGEEGLQGIIKQGSSYQLATLTIGEKRVPRVNLADSDWNQVLSTYDNRCANCSRSEPDIRLQQDHKVPRVRADKISKIPGGPNVLSNWQPLCDECNNFKSTSCRACELDCFKCPWAYPEKYGNLRISHEIVAEFRAVARQLNRDPNELIETILLGFSRWTKNRANTK